MRVRAAGGVILRQHGDGETQVLLVYRGKRRDWTFPKGKVEPGESDEACAVREVEEETGLRCSLDDELPSVAYIDRKGRDKLVRYWAMHVLSGEAEPRNEVDAVRWVAVSRAARLLTHARDRVLVDAVATNGEISA